MSAAVKNPAREAELQRLVAEQEADDTDYVPADGRRSLDAPFGYDDGSLYEVVEEGSLDSGPAQPKPGKRSHKVTKEQVREWRALRNKDYWTYGKIAEYAGVREITVRRHLDGGPRMERRAAMLAEHFTEAREAYEAGAFLREIAELLYDDCGYASWHSCYQELRRLFQREDVPIRPKRISRRGRPEPGASRGDWQRYVRKNNQRQRDRRRKALIRCDAIIKSGRPCRRWAISGGRYCVVHDERTCAARKWTRDVVLNALRTWAKVHGRVPASRDWVKATPDHPTRKTVCDLFGKWNFALYEAGLRARKHPKRRKLGRKALLARGYHDCARPGCTKLVAASRHFCRDRRCQDARFTLVVEPRHGTMVGYKVDGCRCGPCTEANTEHQREYRRSRQVAA